MTEYEEIVRSDGWSLRIYSYQWDPPYCAFYVHNPENRVRDAGRGPTRDDCLAQAKAKMPELLKAEEGYRKAAATKAAKRNKAERVSTEGTTSTN